MKNQDAQIAVLEQQASSLCHQVNERDVQITNLRADLDRALLAGEKLADNLTDNRSERELQIKELDCRIRLLESMAKTPGVQVIDLRRMLQLGSTGIEEVDYLVLNMPTPFDGLG